VGSLEAQPLVSIIAPSFNQGEFIADTIESVLAQDYPRIEYQVVDGGSTDTTLDPLRSYGDRVCWIAEPDNGQADAINKGIALTRGAIVAWLNADEQIFSTSNSGSSITAKCPHGYGKWAGKIRIAAQPDRARYSAVMITVLLLNCLLLPCVLRL